MTSTDAITFCSCGTVHERFNQVPRVNDLAAPSSTDAMRQLGDFVRCRRKQAARVKANDIANKIPR